MMKISKKYILFLFFILTFLSLIIMLTIAYTLPPKTVITQYETHGNWIPNGYRWFLSAKEPEINSVMENNSQKVYGDSSEYTAKVYFCGILPIKDVDVSVIKNTAVIPGGDCIGIELNSKGVLVIGTESFKSLSGMISPAKNAGLKSGDIITEINGKKTENLFDVSSAIRSSEGKITVKGQRGNSKTKWIIIPQKDVADSEKKIGLWIRDSIAGIGTLSFYTDNYFAALGHPISDAETGTDVIPEGGNIYNASIIDIEKGKSGIPGSIKGILSGNPKGNISSNSKCGVFGKTNTSMHGDKIHIMPKENIRTGHAQIICDIGNGKKKYDIDIIRIFSGNEYSKGMVVKVTDKKLLSETGGIIQGMSGSPIIQNGSLVGAITHVFINDPSKGYAIYAENMIKEIYALKK